MTMYTTSGLSTGSNFNTKKDPCGDLFFVGKEVWIELFFAYACSDLSTICILGLQTGIMLVGDK